MNVEEEVLGCSIAGLFLSLISLVLVIVFTVIPVALVVWVVVLVLQSMGVL